MIVEVLRMISTALTDPTTGVNAQIGAVPRDAGDDDPTLRPVTVLVETDDAAAVRNTLPVTCPAIVIRCEESDDNTGAVNAENVLESPNFPVRIYMIDDTANESKRFVSLGHMSRATRRSLAHLFGNEGVEARNRNGILIQTINRSTMTPIVKNGQSGAAHMGFVLSLYMTVLDELAVAL